MMMMMKEVEKRLVNALAEEVQSYVLGNMFHLEENPYLKLQLSKYGIYADVYLDFEIIDKGDTLKIENVSIVDISMSCDTYQVAEEVEQALQPFTAEFPELRDSISKFFKQTVRDNIKKSLIEQIEVLVDNSVDEVEENINGAEMYLPYGYSASVDMSLNIGISEESGDYWHPPFCEPYLIRAYVDDVTIYDCGGNDYRLDDFALTPQELLP